VLYAARGAILPAIGNLLVVRDSPEHADLIFLLNGDTTTRPYHASLLYKQGRAPRVVIARMEDSESVLLGAYPNPTDSNISVLKGTGVPDASIVELRPPGGVMHTIDEARALRAYLEANHFRKVILVTSDLHSRRSRYTFSKVLGEMDASNAVDLRMDPIPDRKYGAANWWRSEDGIIGCFNEYIKLFYYYYKY
jgi:uncharacterized SAM-binding protein YcdF (DUF218 family)